VHVLANQAPVQVVATAFSQDAVSHVEGEGGLLGTNNLNQLVSLKVLAREADVKKFSLAFESLDDDTVGLGVRIEVILRQVNPLDMLAFVLQLLSDLVPQLLHAVLRQVNRSNLLLVENSKNFLVVIIGDAIVSQDERSDAGQQFDAVQQLFDACLRHAAELEAR